MPDETMPSGDAAGAGQHPSAERLHAYLAEVLAPVDAAAIDHHLEHCARCMAALDELQQPVALPAVATGPPVWDERRMRRSVRRTLLRTAWNAILMLVVAAIALQLVAWFVVHPLFVDRGDRMVASVVASIDLPVMTVPGAEMASMNSNVGILRRFTEVEAQRSIGSEVVSLDGYTTRLGPLGMSTPQDAPIMAYGPPLRASTETPFEPDRLASGIAVTVELSWREAISHGEADGVIDAADDLALLWVGFRVPGGDHPEDPAWRLGYSACGGIPEFIEEQGSGFLTSGFGTSGGFRRFPPGQASGTKHALGELRRATANLAATGWLDGEPIHDGALAEVEATAEWLATNDPGVVSVVITGPSAAVAAATEASNPDDATVLEVDFDRGAPEPCG